MPANILVVDDELDLQELMQRKRCLRRTSISVKAVRDLISCQFLERAVFHRIDRRAEHGADVLSPAGLLVDRAEEAHAAKLVRVVRVADERNHACKRSVWELIP